MSSMAKIFVVVNLILAVATFGAAATLLGAQDNYKQAYADQVEKLENYSSDMQQQLEAAKEESRQAQSEKATAQGNFQQARQENAALQATLASAKSEDAKLRSANQVHADNVKTLTDVNDKYNSTIQQLRQKAEDATQAQLNAQKELEAEIANRTRLEQNVAALNQQVKDLAAQLGDLKSENRRLRFENDQMAKKVPGGRVGPGSRGESGRVNGVRTLPGGGVLVTVSVGSADGVREGDTYHIRRGGEYIGMIEITSVNENLATGQFDTKFSNNKGNPEVGDTAYPDR